MFCIKCGKEFEDGMKFCTNCGIAFDSNEQEEKLVKKDSICNKVGNGFNTFILIRNIGVIIVLILFGISSCTYGVHSLENMASKNKVTAENIANEYSVDRMSADSQYKDKPIEISGKVLGKGQYVNDSSLFLELVNTTDNIRVLIAMEADKKDLINAVDVGNIIEAKGVCNGAVEQEDGNVAIQINAKSID